MALVFMEFYKGRKQSQFSVLMKSGNFYKKKKKQLILKNLDLKKKKKSNSTLRGVGSIARRRNRRKGGLSK